jgi:hypothetical protein
MNTYFSILLFKWEGFRGSDQYFHLPQKKGTRALNSGHAEEGYLIDNQ